MSHNCDCNDNLTILPLRGLAVDASVLTANCDCGPGSGDFLSYSLEEQFTGKYWIDGKKIYQKTVVVVGVSTTRKYAPHNIDNLGMVISIGGFALELHNGAEYSCPIPHVGFGNGNNIAFCTDNSSIELMSYKENRPNWTFYFTLQYTCTDR